MSKRNKAAIALFSIIAVSGIAVSAKEGIDSYTFSKSRRLNIDFENAVVLNALDGVQFISQNGEFSFVKTDSGEGVDLIDDYFSIDLIESNVDMKEPLTVSFRLKTGNVKNASILTNKDFLIFLRDQQLIVFNDGQYHVLSEPIANGEEVQISVVKNVGRHESIDFYIDGDKRESFIEEELPEKEIEDTPTDSIFLGNTVKNDDLKEDSFLIIDEFQLYQKALSKSQVQSTIRVSHAFGYEDMELKGAETRQERGSNYWLSSNLREWLNSDQQTVRYTTNAPATGYVNNYAYDKEAGFLSHFTQAERDGIAVTERGNVFGANDKAASTNGKTGTVSYNHNSSKSMNFEYPGVLKKWDNYGQVVANDKIFLLTFKEMAEYVQNRGWSVMKTPTSYVSSKFGYSSSSNVAYYIYHPIHDTGNEYLEIISANPNAISVNTNAMNAQGIAPAMHLKKDTNVRRIKEYDVTNINATWTNTVSTVKAKDLNIGDIVEYGAYFGEPIQWRVINRTDDGYPLLLSEKVIDVKAFDAKGDYARRFSYIDIEKIFPIADVSTTKFQIQNIQGSSDKQQISVEILNEAELSERKNDEFTLNIKVSDNSGIAYVEYPDGKKVNVNAKTYTFDYKISENGNFVFGLMDIKGNFRYFVIPAGNINLPPKVEVSVSNQNWTNQNVSVNIKATNDVGWAVSSLLQSNRDTSGSTWSNYTTYIGKRIRVTGKVEYVSDKNGFVANNFKTGPGFTYKKVVKNGDEYDLSWTWPMPISYNLGTIKENMLNGIGPTEFDFIYTVPNDYFGSFNTRLHISLTAAHYGNVTIKWSDVKYELLDNDDFAITKIELPSGKTTTSQSYSETISAEGQTSYTYKVHDNRGMVTEKTITVKIDKTKPTISVTGNPTSWTTSDATLSLSFADSLSGIKEIVLPDGRKTYTGQKAVNLNYTVKENGDYTFKVIDQAGNQTSTTVKVTKIDKSAKAVENISSKMSMVDTSNSKRQLKFEFPAVIDSISGTKGYSYVIDTKADTIPDNTVDTTQTVLTKEVTDNQTYYLHIKTIDNAGNVSTTSHAKVVIPTLTAEANNLEDMIRLDWTSLEKSTYKVYQKKPGDNEFQTISTTDLSAQGVVKVLNIYPDKGSLVTFTDWKGNTHSLKKAALLKKWMEEPNDEHPKGYGQGLIDVTPVSTTEFNANPLKVLKTNGEWNYDVIMFGSWDGGEWINLCDEGAQLIHNYINEGYGVLFGHDSIHPDTNVSNMWQFAEYLKLKVAPGYVLGDNKTQQGVGGEVVRVLKRGLLTTYPWEIDRDDLTIPLSHTTSQLTNADIWLDFPNVVAGEIGWSTIPNRPYIDSELRTNNHYLVTNNNVAMIQTGHTPGAATSDEQKMIANTLFYLKQLSAINFLDDYSGQDVSAPTSPKLISSTIDEQGKLVMGFEPSTDTGSMYEYYVEAESKNGGSLVTSNVVKETVLTGVKGYSYVIDNNPDTEPDNKIEIEELEQIIFNQSDFGKYLHIKAVDNGRGGGNASETVHIKIEGLVLEANAKPDENMIRLDWTEMEESTYKLYQKKPNSEAFQTVSLTSFDSSTRVNVLNVHPNVGSEISCTTWDGEQVTVPASASAKCWMEAPNSESDKGYGKGVIEIDLVTIEDFNANPTAYIKTNSNDFKYDVIFFGTWDSNGSKNLGANTLPLLQEFLDSGRGVLFGHDTIVSSRNFGKLRDYVNIQVPGDSEVPSAYNNDNYRVGSAYILKNKTGLLNSYPWTIDQSQLTVPRTHSSRQWAGGDVWYEFTNIENGFFNGYDDGKVFNGINGNVTNNFYLTTWNNAAMIQTGHSSGKATPDEQKVLANTLFYLNQLSTNNFLDDYSGQDVAAPTNPSIKSVSYTMDNKINVVINPSKDNSSTYEYYVESERKDGSFIATSNKVSETIITGLAGYSYIVDNNPTSIPDDKVDTTSTTIQVPTNIQGRYFIHIKALDKAGNASETIHYELTDITKPSLVVTANTTNWTNQDVVLTAVAQDNESGLKYIHLPNNTKVTASSVTYAVSTNGTYTFRAEDFMGNVQTVDKVVSNIDKVAPTGMIQIANGESKIPSEETEIKIQYSDDLSGIAKIEVYDLDANGNPLSATHVINNPDNGSRTLSWILKPYEDVSNPTIRRARVGMKITDKAGNVKTLASQEVIIESIEITGFSLTNVVNPSIYNNSNPFKTLRYPNIPVQKMVSGGSFGFKVNYRFSDTIPATYRMDYQAVVHYIGPNGYNKSYPMTLINQRLTGEFEMTHEIPFDVPNGTSVYIEVGIALNTDSGRLYAMDTFPKPQGTKLQIGVIDGDIRGVIKFNEIK